MAVPAAIERVASERIPVDEKATFFDSREAMIRTSPIPFIQRTPARSGRVNEADRGWVFRMRRMTRTDAVRNPGRISTAETTGMTAFYMSS
jgi:hypothetical protein